MPGPAPGLPGSPGFFGSLGSSGSVALCVLAGGAGRRLGGRDKALLDLGDGQPLLARVLSRLSSQQAPWPGPVLVSTHHEDCAARLAAVAAPVCPVTVVTDTLMEHDPSSGPLSRETGGRFDHGHGRAGPLAGLLAALEAVSHSDSAVTWLVSVPVDLPFVPPDLLARLWTARQAVAAPGVYAVSRGRAHPLVALWPVAGAAAALRRAMVHEGVRRAREWAVRQGLGQALWPDGAADPFLNINDPSTLEIARVLPVTDRGEGDPRARLFP